MNDHLQDILMPGETVFWQGRPHKFSFIVKSVIGLVPLALIFLAFDSMFIKSFLRTEVPKEMLIFLVIFFAFHLLPVWLCISKLLTSSIAHKNIIYAITDRRIISRSGVAGIDFTSIDYVDISNITVNVSPLEHIFSVGSLLFSTNSGVKLSFIGIENPYEVYKQVNKIFVDIKSDTYYPNAKRPEENPGYNTKYNGRF